MFNRTYNLVSDCQAYFDFQKLMQVKMREIQSYQTAVGIYENYVQCITALRSACDNSTGILTDLVEYGAMDISQAIGLKPISKYSKKAPAFGILPKASNFNFDEETEKYNSKIRSDIKSFFIAYKVLIKSLKKYGFTVDLPKQSELEKRFTRKNYIILNVVVSRSLTEQINAASETNQSAKNVDTSV